MASYRYCPGIYLELLSKTTKTLRIANDAAPNTTAQRCRYESPVRGKQVVMAVKEVFVLKGPWKTVSNRQRISNQQYVERDVRKVPSSFV
jgi:hypothetical protein